MGGGGRVRGGGRGGGGQGRCEGRSEVFLKMLFFWGGGSGRGRVRLRGVRVDVNGEVKNIFWGVGSVGTGCGGQGSM